MAIVMESAFSRSRPSKATACATLPTSLREPIKAELASRSTSAEKATSVRRTAWILLSGTSSCAVSRKSFTATGRNGGRFLRAHGWAVRANCEAI